MTRRMLVIWLIAAMLGAALTLTVEKAAASEADTLARQAGISLELAQADLATQHAHPEAVEKVSAALGGSYGGLYFNVKTDRFVIPLPPGASKAAAKAAIGTLASYPLVERTLAQVKATAAALEGELAPLVAEGKAQVVADERANRPRVYYGSNLPSESKTAVKTAAAAYGGTTTATKTLAVTPDACAIRGGSEPGAYCDDRALGGVRINSPLRYDPERGWLSYFACSAGLVVETPQGRAVLTAGHCEKDAGGTWVPRETWHCETPPFGGCGPVAPWPVSANECHLNEGPWRQDEGGDFALMMLEGCVSEPAVATWYGPSETALVQAYQHAIFDCIEPGCNDGVPASERAYVGLFQCHYGMNAAYEQEARYGGPQANCGLVKYVDVAALLSYASGPVLVHHLDLTCARGLPGDSGSPWVAAAKLGHVIATGIEIGGSSRETTQCGALGNSYGDEVGVALSALRASL